MSYRLLQVNKCKKRGRLVTLLLAPVLDPLSKRFVGILGGGLLIPNVPLKAG